MLLVVKYFWMYMLLGVICNILWGIINTSILLHACKYDYDLYREAFGVWLEDIDLFDRMVNTISNVLSKEERKSIDKRKTGTLSASFLICAVIRSTLVWPANIAFGVTRLQVTLNWIEENSR